MYITNVSILNQSASSQVKKKTPKGPFNVETTVDPFFNLFFTLSNKGWVLRGTV